MNIHAVTVSVDYSEELSRSIGRWISSLASLTVVTAARDEATISLAREAGASLHVTDAFWLGGALFNKGRAIQEAREFLPPHDWHLFLDADVVPPSDWLEAIEDANPQAGWLHGALRRKQDGTPIDDHEMAGFFHLFHSSDPRGKPPLELDWLHAGNYDSAFIHRWGKPLQRILPLSLEHIGEPRKNWCGKGNDAAMAEMLARRRARSWRNEKIGR